MPDRRQRTPPVRGGGDGLPRRPDRTGDPRAGRIGAIDAGVTGALVLYGGKTSISAAGEVISHGLALLVPIVAGAVAFTLLPGEISRTRGRAQLPVPAPAVTPAPGPG